MPSSSVQFRFQTRALANSRICGDQDLSSFLGCPRIVMVSIFGLAVDRPSLESKRSSQKTDLQSWDFLDPNATNIQSSSIHASIQWNPICNDFSWGAEMKMETQAFSLAASRFSRWLSACLAYGIGFPRPSAEVNRTIGTWGFSMLGSGSSSLAFLSWLDWLGSTFSEMRPLYVRLVSPLRLTAFTGSRWPTGDTSIPALGLTVGWRSRSYS